MVPRARRPPIFDRLATWTVGLEGGGYFASERRRRRLPRRTRLHARHPAPNSPQWFNTGLHWNMASTVPAGHLLRRPFHRQADRPSRPYEHPQPHACFIQSVGDDLVNEAACRIFGCARRGCQIRFGHRFELLLSLRGEGEKLSGGSKSVRPDGSQMKRRAAGAVKSGATPQDGHRRRRPPRHRAPIRLEGEGRAEGRLAGQNSRLQRSSEAPRRDHEGLRQLRR